MKSVCTSKNSDFKIKWKYTFLQHTKVQRPFENMFFKDAAAAENKRKPKIGKYKRKTAKKTIKSQE